MAYFESRLERLIERGFARLFGGSLQPREVALQLAKAIEDETRSNDEGQDFAPTQYIVILNPKDYDILLSQTPDLQQQLAEQVYQYCVDALLELAQYPSIELRADAQITTRQIQITAHHEAASYQQTQIMDRVLVEVEDTFAPPPNAHLMLDGTRRILLDREIFNIGRRPDNDLVIDDPLISRHHVQLRLRDGHYILHDAGSKTGTFVNGGRVKQHRLVSGDSIHLGGCSMFYMDDAAEDGPGETNPDMKPPSQR